MLKYKFYYLKFKPKKKREELTSLLKYQVQHILFLKIIKKQAIS
ncbi:borrelia PFam54 protein, truncated (plasmid) [Borreliella bissettiae DN127]|uniref:Borrelia PFam54 protein, truncated n=1 Tax=Borrelia bissettiae (strain DSM 17990 / CIP 109136 / DN127) TaxID=521010 RepID=G0API8_BORBD|nr:borrelia PFam54 protein, truncated [Borreliella bissettiae DN127]